MNTDNQKSAPFYEALERLRKQRIVPFDVPGHKRGRGNPELVKLLDERHIQYNRMLDKIAYLEKEGRIHVIRPDRDISAKPVERDPAHLKEIYEVGRRVMKADMEKLKAYLAE